MVRVYTCTLVYNLQSCCCFGLGLNILAVFPSLVIW